MGLAEAEREKYEAIWRHDDYRRQAPGEGLVGRAIDALGMEPGDSVIDFGCGTGRPAKKLQDAGMVVTGVDHADNCLDADVAINFYRGCLWDLPPDLEAHWGYCTDVMEHIPPERVEDVLRNIRDAAQCGCFFQVATRPDVMGKLVGQPLHLTVQDADWWRDLFTQYWDSVAIDASGGGFVAVCR